MVITIAQSRMESERDRWQGVLRVGENLLRQSRNGEERDIALRKIVHARRELAALQSLESLAVQSAAPAVVLTKAPVQFVRTRIRRVLYPTQPKPAPDRKAAMRLRDEQLRKRMRGIPRSDDSRGHGHRGNKK